MIKGTFISLAAALAFSVSSCAYSEEEKVLNVYNWSDYIDPEVIPEFEKETGIKVVYDVFDSNEVLEAKMLSGKSGYDIVAPGSDFLSRQIQAGVYLPLDKSKLSNYKNLDEEQMKMLASLDKDNTYAIPYQQGSTGIAYNKKMIAAGHIYQMMLDTDVSNVKCLTIANADVAEFLVNEESPITKTEVKDLRLPSGVTLGGMVRNGVGSPVYGNTRIQAGDIVVLFCKSGLIKDMDRYFAKPASAISRIISSLSH